MNTPHNEIGRKQPFYYYFIVVLWGFIPWIFSIIAVFIDKIKNWGKLHYVEKVINFDFSTLDNTHKLLALCWVTAFWIMLFFSMSSTKLATYILPVYFPLAVITGLMWKDYVDKQKHEKPISISVQIFGWFCVVAGIAAMFTPYYLLAVITGLMWKDYVDKQKHEKPISISVQIFGWFCVVAGIAAMFTPYYLPAQLNHDIAEIRWFSLICLLVFGTGTLLFVKFKKYLGVFVFYVLFMAVVSAFATEEFFEVDYKFGQQDLIEFAKYAKDYNYTISANGMDRKYSLLYYNDEQVDYNPLDRDYHVIEKDLKKTNNVVIIKNKVLEDVQDKLDFVIIKKGRRYTMIKGKK